MPLLTRTDLAVTLTQSARERRAEALSLAVDIESVTTPQENERANDAIKCISSLLSDVEKDRKEVKAPVIECGRAIDAAAKEFVERLLNERARIATLAGDYIKLQEAKARAEEAARNVKLLEIERAREAALAKAETHEERDRVQAESCAIAATLPVVKPAEAPKGQIVRHEWTFVVTDPYELLRNHPDLCEIVPRRAMILDALRAGRTIKGIEAKLETRVR